MAKAPLTATQLARKARRLDAQALRAMTEAAAAALYAEARRYHALARAAEQAELRAAAVGDTEPFPCKATTRDHDDREELDFERELTQDEIAAINRWYEGHGRLACVDWRDAQTLWVWYEAE